jgi:hypothetical protein
MLVFEPQKRQGNSDGEDAQHSQRIGNFTITAIQ